MKVIVVAYLIGVLMGILTCLWWIGRTMSTADIHQAALLQQEEW